MKKTTALFAALAFAAPAAATGISAPVAETLTYRAYIGGLPLGNLNLNIAMDEAGYATRAQFDMTALLRLILDTDAKASAEGRWQGGRAVPQKFDYWVRDRDERRTSEMIFSDGGDPVEVRADPPFRIKPYGMSIEQARGALDPASAAVMMAAPRGAACDLNLTVFDGQKLHGISLARSAQQPTGDTVYCTGRYERLAGFKDKHMQPDVRTYDFVAELRPAGAGRWQPTKVWAPTKFGVATAVLQ